MNIITALLILAIPVAWLLPDRYRLFAFMTLASIVLLHLAPRWLRGHVHKIGTYVHELCHGIAAWISGGEFLGFQVGETGGLAWSSGGDRRPTAMAGYIGAVPLGAALIARSANMMETPVEK